MNMIQYTIFLWILREPTMNLVGCLQRFSLTTTKPISSTQSPFGFQIYISSCILTSSGWIHFNTPAFLKLVLLYESVSHQIVFTRISPNPFKLLKLRSLNIS